MKSFYLGLICLMLVSSCKSDNKEVIPVETKKEIALAEKIANAHGFENWKNVSKVSFTFQVDKDTLKGKGRTWTWFPKEDKVLLRDNDTTYNYIRSQVDSTTIAIDKAFINDKFWLLIPFQMVWDTSANISEPKKSEAPISKTELNMTTLTYSDNGGYTPGDAYDIYYDDNYIIKEWTYRKGNSEAPSLSTTFENIKIFNGIKIAMDHKQEGATWNLNFTDVSITLDTKK
ncbi:hypothetical protein [Winogradskyella wichelsiae]|uniref:hypothetical protein n=1 Tax=Winogradskyella wichelsiae TaxID=2697007 RepID=UPI003EFA53F1